METGFADCIYCGGQVQERTATREVRRQGELFLIEQVPMGACTQCGERFLKPERMQPADPSRPWARPRLPHADHQCQRCKGHRPDGSESSS